MKFWRSYLHRQLVRERDGKEREVYEVNFDACRNEREPVEAVLAAKLALASRCLVKRMLVGDMHDHYAASAAGPWMWTRADFDACLDGVEGADDEGKAVLADLRAAIEREVGS